MIETSSLILGGDQRPSPCIDIDFPRLRQKLVILIDQSNPTYTTYIFPDNRAAFGKLLEEIGGRA